MADEGKRGSNASQYDNVPGADLENDNSADEVLERTLPQSLRNAAYFSSTRKLAEKTSSPPKISNNYAFNSQPRVPRYSSQSDETDLGHSIKLPPPSYSNPPVYHGNSPKHVSNVVNSSFAQYNHGNPTYSPSRSYAPSLPTETFTDQPPVNYSVSHQNLTVTPSSRIEVLPSGNYATNPKSPPGENMAHRIIDIQAPPNITETRAMDFQCRNQYYCERLYVPTVKARRKTCKVHNSLGLAVHQNQ
uniref:Uncharacterized protein n=1 Tax=Sphaerodactylus townsendi TaxID=933632 RepID=A0ACB8FLQ5_9SAUR